MHYTAQPVEPLALAVGDKVKFEEDRKWWLVKAVSENFVALTRPVEFKPHDSDEVYYTVIDWRNGVRGPCNLIGQGYGDGTYSEEECAEMLTEFEYDYKQDPDYLEAVRAFEVGEADRVSWPSKPHLEVSQRNWVRVNIEGHRKAA